MCRHAHSLFNQLATVQEMDNFMTMQELLRAGLLDILMLSTVDIVL